MVDALFATAIINTAKAADDVVDHTLKRFVIAGGGDDDAITIEAGLGEDFGGVGAVGYGDAVSIGLAEIGQDLLGGGEQPCALFSVVVDGDERQGVEALDQIIWIFELGGGPFDGGEDLRGANAAILVAIDQLQGAGIKLHSFGGAAQRHPQFLIELIQRQ